MDEIALASKDVAIPEIPWGDHGLVIRNLREAWQFARCAISAGMVRRDFDTPAKVVTAMQAGAELGMSWMQSLQVIYVVNGIPTVYGDGLPALILGSGKLAESEEWFEDGSTCLCQVNVAPLCLLCHGRGLKRLLCLPAELGDNHAAVCRTVRNDPHIEKETVYSVADAKRAGLWGKTDAWRKTPQRMLPIRARSWNYRDQFADVLKGIGIKEEVEDYVRQEVDEEAVDLHGNSVKLLRAKLHACGCQNDDDMTMVCRWVQQIDPTWAGEDRLTDIAAVCEDKKAPGRILDFLVRWQREWKVPLSEILVMAREKLVGDYLEVVP